MNINERSQPAAWLISLVSACAVVAPFLTLILLRQATPWDIRIDHGVRIAALIGIPVAAVVWHNFQRYLVCFSIWKLAGMVFLLMVSVYMGQIGGNILLSSALAHMHDLEMSISETLPVYVILSDTSTAGIAMLISLAVTWIFLRRSAGRPAISFVTASYTFCIFAAFSFSVFAFMNWVEAQQPLMTLLDFMPREYVTLSKVFASGLFALGVTLLLRATVLRRESCPMVIAIPWATVAAATSLYWSSWIIAQLVESNVQIHHAVSGFVLGILLCFSLCAVPLLVQAGYGRLSTYRGQL